MVVRKPRSLVTQKLEMVSKEVFKNHKELIIELIGNSHGIYALYDERELYYVGKSIDLKKRVNRHLQDRHKASWSYFSLYLVRNADHISEIESLLVRISSPKGNRNVPKGRSSGPMLKTLKKMVKDKHRKEFDSMFGTRKSSNRKVLNKKSSNLTSLVTKKTPIFKTYKGKEYKGILTPAGKIYLKKKVFTSPSAAAMSIIDRGAVNGWKFWYVKDTNGNIVQLDSLRN